MEETRHGVKKNFQGSLMIKSLYGDLNSISFSGGSKLIEAN